MAVSKIISIVTVAGERVPVTEQRTPRRSFGRMFQVSFLDEAAKLAVKVRSAATFKVLLILPRHLSYMQYRRLDQRKLGAELGLDAASVSRAMKELHSFGVVDRRGTGPVTEWKLTPEFGWYGDVASYHATRRARALLGTPANSEATPAVVAEDIFQKDTSALAPLAPQRRLRLLMPIRS